MPWPSKDPANYTADGRTAAAAPMVPAPPRVAVIATVVMLVAVFDLFEVTALLVAPGIRAADLLDRR